MIKYLIPVPADYNFDLNFKFLERSPKELLHRLEKDRVIKLLRIGDEQILFAITPYERTLSLEFLNIEPPADVVYLIIEYIKEWFDLETNLDPFYTLAAKDSLLKKLVIDYHGYRIVGQPDLFESLVWAVLGQQINVAFAYTLKQKFVERFGGKLIWEGQDYFMFPRAETVAQLNDEHLLPLQFSRQKSKYTVNIAEAFANGKISKAKLKGLPLEDAKQHLMEIKGVGNWTANYALMKTFRYRDAFPLEDAGIHNAIKRLKKLETKPTLEEVKKIFKKYKGWEAYATLYLWKSL